MLPVAFSIACCVPPLSVGAEVMAILIGYHYEFDSFWIMLIPTVAGETLAYLIVKRLCLSRSEAFAQTKSKCACLAKTVQDGGFKMILLARCSIVPPHTTTAVFATRGVSLLELVSAMVYSFPKQIVRPPTCFCLRDSSKDAPKPVQPSLEPGRRAQGTGSSIQQLAARSSTTHYKD